MVRRLVLGCGSVGRVLIEGLSGPGELSVIEDDEGRAETLREDGIAVELADPTDPAVIRALGADAGTIIVAGDDPATNREAARTAREMHPDANLVAYSGVRPDPETRAAMDDTADRLVDYGTAVATRVLEGATGETGARLHGLRGALRDAAAPLGVFTHDNPDPDAIGSALALRELARSMGLDAEACYFGDIAHQENRALVNLLDISLRRLGEGFDPAEFGSVALVDHARPGVNDQLPPNTPVDIVIDHHPPREVVDAGFVDLREEAGATSTLLADYYRRFGVDPDATLATALLYGIRVDTSDFDREVAPVDFEAAAFLLPFADLDVLERVENPSIGGETIDVLGRAIRSRDRRGSVLVSNVGTIGNRDALAQAADQLLGMAGVTTTLIYGRMDGTVYLSARTRGTDLDVGEAVRQAFDRIGSAGGHADMAGAQLPLGILGTVDEESGESLDDAVSEMIANRFFEVVGPGADEGSPPIVRGSTLEE